MCGDLIRVLFSVFFFFFFFYCLQFVFDSFLFFFFFFACLQPYVCQSYVSSHLCFSLSLSLSLRMFRVSTFHYPNSMMETERSLTCSACGGKGHTKKNKLCPNHMQEGMGNQDIAESDTET